jgi:hypothetical protein
MHIHRKEANRIDTVYYLVPADREEHEIVKIAIRNYLRDAAAGKFVLPDEHAASLSDVLMRVSFQPNLGHLAIGIESLPAYQDCLQYVLPELEEGDAELAEAMIGQISGTVRGINKEIADIASAEAEKASDFFPADWNKPPGFAL